MTGPVFVDTNILVYARDAAEPKKQAMASDLLRELWKTRQGRISSQVLQEYYVTVTRKFKPGLPKSEARKDINDLQAWNPMGPSLATFSKAWNIEDKFGLSWWDSLVLASALDQQCSLLLSEDLQDGMEVDSLTIQNPFLDGWKL